MSRRAGGATRPRRPGGGDDGTAYLAPETVTQRLGLSGHTKGIEMNYRSGGVGIIGVIVIVVVILLLVGVIKL